MAILTSETFFVEDALVGGHPLGLKHFSVTWKKIMCWIKKKLNQCLQYTFFSNFSLATVRLLVLTSGTSIFVSFVSQNSCGFNHSLSNQIFLRIQFSDFNSSNGINIGSRIQPGSWSGAGSVTLLFFVTFFTHNFFFFAYIAGCLSEKKKLYKISKYLNMILKNYLI